jgi:hypothetical protein
VAAPRGFIATEDDSLEWLFPWPIPRTRATPEVRRYGDGLAELRYALRRPSI